MRPRLVVPGVVLAVALAGCLGGAAPGATPTGPTPTATPAGTPTEGSLSVHFLDVGQGDATLLVGPGGETMLIDTGDFRDDGGEVIDYLRERGIDRIDHLVTTHADADHVGGHAALIEYLETEGEGVGAVYDPGIAASTAVYDRYLDAVEAYDVPLYRTVEGDSIPFDGAEVSVLGPPQPYLADGDRNENSVVLRVTFGEAALLLTGDAEREAEAHLVGAYGTRLSADVLKVGHHGSDSSSSGPFLDAVDPDVAVVSSAYDSRYGHPHEEVLGRLAARSIPTFWTGVHGDVVVVTDGSTVSVRSQAAATTDPLDLRSYSAVGPGSDAPAVERATFGADSGALTPATPDGAGVEVAITEVNADAAGDDRENVNGEYVVLTNRGESAVDLSGWTVADAADHVYEFPDGTTLGPGESVTLYTGSGTDGDGEFYWGQSGPVWNNDGDTVTLRTDGGELVDEVDYRPMIADAPDPATPLDPAPGTADTAPGIPALAPGTADTAPLRGGG